MSAGNTNSSHKLNGGNVISLSHKLHQTSAHIQQKKQQQIPKRPDQKPPQPVSLTTATTLTSSSSAQQFHSQSIQSHSSAAPTTVQHKISSGHHQHQNHQSVLAANSNSSSGIPTSTILPRYHPPPQPNGGHSGGSVGILKQQISNPAALKAAALYPTSGVQAELSFPHLNIKYPSENTKLPSGNPSRFAQRPPPHRLSTSSGGVGGHIPVLVTNGGSGPTGTGSTGHHDEHLIRQQQQQAATQEMLKFVRKSDSDQSVTTTNGVNANGSSEARTSSGGGSGRLTMEQNRHLQALLSELRQLKDANQRLGDDNQELRDLCCFLDDDRQKGRKLAREWQRFGRYTASVMRQEVSAYQNKLRQLDDKQQELIRDNLELKELCLYLDEERAHVAANTLCASCGAATRPVLRDDGDGSSSSTNADELSAIRQFDRQLPELHLRTTLSDQTLQYVRCLERRIRQLEEERLAGNANNQQNSELISGRPEAVVRALQVLEVREQLERDRIGNPSATPEQMDDGEKALVREMCNVVWRKLEESPNGPNMDPL